MVARGSARAACRSLIGAWRPSVAKKVVRGCKISFSKPGQHLSASSATTLQKATLANETREQDSYFRSAKACKLAGNQNACKPARTIEFGWYHNGLGVRKSNGGGTRKIIIGKRLKHADHVKEGKNKPKHEIINKLESQEVSIFYCIMSTMHNLSR